MCLLKCFLPPDVAAIADRYMQEQRFKERFPVLYARALLDKIGTLAEFYTDDLLRLLENLENFLRAAEQGQREYNEKVHAILDQLLSRNHLSRGERLWLITAAKGPTHLAAALEHLVMMVEDDHREVLTVTVEELQRADRLPEGWIFKRS